MAKAAKAKKATAKGKRDSYNAARVIPALHEYFNRPTTQSEVKQVQNKDGTVTEIDVDVACEFPTMLGFASSLGVSRMQISGWERKHPDFKQAIEVAKSHQARILIENGIKGRYQNSFAIFTAKNILKWHDNNQLTGKNGGPIELSMLYSAIVSKTVAASTPAVIDDDSAEEKPAD